MYYENIEPISIVLKRNDKYIKGTIELGDKIIVSDNLSTYTVQVDWLSSMFSVTNKKIPVFAFIKQPRPCFNIRDKFGIKLVFCIVNENDGSEERIRYFLVDKRDKAKEECDHELARIKAEKKRYKELEHIKAERKHQEELEWIEDIRKHQEELERIEAEKKRQGELERIEAEKNRQKELEHIEDERKRQEELERIEAEKKRQKELERVEAERKRQEELFNIECESEFYNFKNHFALKEAKSKVKGSINWKDEYLKYVTERAPSTAGDIYLAMTTVEQYAIESKIFNCSFYEIFSPETVNILNQKVMNNANFNINNRDIKRFVKSGISILNDFIDKNIDFLMANCSNDSSTSEMNPFDKKTSFAVNSVELIEDVSLSNPNKLYIFGKTFDVSSWVNLFVVFLSEANNHSLDFLDTFYKNQLLNNSRRLAKASNISLLRKPASIPNTVYYVETSITAIGLLKAINKFCQELNIKSETVFISYIGTVKYKETYSANVNNESDIIDVKPVNNMPDTTNSPSKETTESVYINDTTAESSISQYLKVDFNQSVSLGFTKPVRFSYFEESYNELKSWTDLYVQIMKLLANDYPKKICTGLRLHNEGSIDVGNLGLYNSMKSPKKLSGTLFLETNLSTTDIVKKIKFALDLCYVDYENLEIEYCSDSEYQLNIQQTSQDSPIKTRAELDTDHPFYKWMVNEANLTQPSAKNYFSNIHSAETIARLQKFSSWKLISTNDYDEVIKTYKLLFKNSLFTISNTKSHNAYTAAINKYIQYLQSLPNSSSSIIKSQLLFDLNDVVERKSEFDAETITSYKNVLRQKFIKGFRLSSPLDMRKFKAWYEEIEYKSLPGNDDKIKRCISQCGIVYDEKLFLVESLLSEEVKNKLFLYIEKTFDSGKSAIYYDALYEDFHDDFICERIYDTDMLKLYLQGTLKGNYYYSRAYISQEMFVKLEFDEEIKECLIKHGTPVLTENICNELSHIPQDKIRRVLSNNKDFISNSRGEYFHCSLINFNGNDLENIADFINSAIDDKEYISFNELLEAIQKKYPHIIDNNSVLSNLGLRGAITYSLREKFFFDNNVISKYGEFLSMADIYADYSKSRDRFTIEELRLLKNEIQSGNIYLESIYPNTLRISEDTFVARNNACFNVPSTDASIDMFLNGKDYLPLKDISSFGSFPYAGFPWNIFLLEHYVAEFSDKFKLIHTTYNESNCVGAIVRKSANINSFDELVAVALAESDIILTDSKALDYLCNKGYLVVRRFKGTKQAIIKAKEIRNKKGKN